MIWRFLFLYLFVFETVYSPLKTYFIWSQAARRSGGIRFAGFWDWTNVTAPLSTVNSYLDAGLPVVIETRAGSARNITHFVVFTGRSGSTYYMNDPIDGAKNISFNGRYGDPGRWIYGMRAYSH